MDEEQLLFSKKSNLYLKLIAGLAICMSIFQLYVALKPINPWILYVTHLGFALILTFLYFPVNKTKIQIIFDLILILIALIATIYYIYQTENILYRIGVAPTIWDIIIGSFVILMVLENARRSIGLALPIISLIFILYGIYGHYIPGFLGHAGISWDRLVSYLVGQEGIFSTPLSTTARFVFLYILFGSLLHISGTGKFFIDFSMGLAGSRRGGPAKVAVLSSALFGTISGASTTNVVTTGTFTIPMMKKIGFKNKYAGAVEAVASTGGQIMPPVMGSAAFILAGIVGIPYYEVMVAAIIPALLYFLAILFMVDFESAANGLKGLTKEQLPKLKTLIIKQGHLILPIIVLLVMLLYFNSSAMRAAIWAIGSTMFIIILQIRSWKDVIRLFEGLSRGALNALSLISAVACAGIVIGVLSITGTGLQFAGAVLSIAGENLPIALLLSMLASIILGMGLPTTAAYLICAAVVAPALVNLGVPVLAAHLFILYFAAVSAITPPVGLAAYAAASIARVNPINVALTSMKLGIVAYIIPFMFVYQPALLSMGGIWEISLSVVTAIVGVYILSAGLQGWYITGKIQWLSRGVLMISSLTMIWPGIKSDLVGFALASIITLFEYYKPNNRPMDKKRFFFE